MFPDDIWRAISTFMDTHTILMYRIVNGLSRDVSRYHQPCMNIRGNLKYWRSSFPHATKIHFLYPREFRETEFLNLTNVSTLKVRTYKSITLVPRMFTYMPNLTSLNLLGCTPYGTDFTNAICPQLIRLTELTLDNNCSITDVGISHLKNLTYLYIHNVRGVTTKGLSGLIHLVDLNLYNMEVTDELFDTVNKIERFSDTFGKITHVGISKLKRLTRVSLNHMRIQNLEGFDALPLTHVTITYCPIHDIHLKYLSHVRKLLLYDTPGILGNGFHFLERVEDLAVHRMAIRDEYIDELLTLRHLKTVHMYETALSKKKKEEMTQKLHGIFHSEVLYR